MSAERNISWMRSGVSTPGSGRPNTSETGDLGRSRLLRLSTQRFCLVGAARDERGAVTPRRRHALEKRWLGYPLAMRTFD